MTYKNYLALVLLCCLCWTACNKKTTDSVQKDPVKKGETSPTKTADLKGTWSVVNFPFNGKPFVPTKFYKITFDGRNIGLKLDVNTCGGAYTESDNTIKLTDDLLSCTEACCDTKEAMALARLFKGTLKYSAGSNVLTINTPEGDIKLSNTQTSLLGTSWVANHYINLKEGKPIPFTKEYILTFEPKSIQLRLDVNNCNTSYTYNERDMILELPANSMACTRKCCDSKDGEILMNSLNNRIHYKREGNKLTLSTNNKKIEFTLFDSSNKE